MKTKKQLTLCVNINAAIVIVLSAYMLLIPAVMLIQTLRNPCLYSGDQLRCAFHWHKSLTPRFEKWARKRVESGAAKKLTTKNVAGTEWPVFCSVFYLWATEALQEVHYMNPTLAPSAPQSYARGAVSAAAELIIDPDHATWVKELWGDNYLTKENLFYRMLLISGLTSYQKILGDKKYENLLRSQVESLASEIDASPYGLLDDYPGQCYPVDVLPAIAAIKRADKVLGTDHSKFVARAIRGFQDTRLDEDTGLPAYIVDSKTGRAKDSARGVGMSFMLIWAPELWPQTARDWYAKYEMHFWQQGRWFAGFREYPKGIDVGLFQFNAVDTGPVIDGYGFGACFFGIGAARAMGRPDHTYPLAAQAIVAAWPLPNGMMLGSRILSYFSDAPYLGESALLFALTRRPVEISKVIDRGKLPWSVYAGVLLGISIGTYVIGATILRIWRWDKADLKVPAASLQLAAWSLLIIAAMLIWTIFSVWIGLIFLLAAQLIPFRVKLLPKNTEPDSPGETGKEDLPHEKNQTSG
jgi:hypothetical protein